MAALRPVHGLMLRGLPWARPRGPRSASGPFMKAERVAFLISVLLHAAVLVAVGVEMENRWRDVESATPERTVLEVRLLPAAPADARPTNPRVEPKEQPVPRQRWVAKGIARDTKPARDAVSMRREEALVSPVDAKPSRIANAVDSAPRTPVVSDSSPSAAFSSAERRGSSLGSGAPAATPAAYLESPVPAYPESAREDAEEGAVVLRVRISTEGAPAEILVHRSSGVAALDRAALRAVKRWKFTPATIAGKPIESWMDVPIRFRLDGT